MADYTKATNFTAKDGLPSGNAGKIVKGTEIDTELTAVSNAIASKSDINSPTFTGTPAGPTASAGTNTTQFATTAFATAAVQSLYPVGSIYINATSSTNPSVLFGFGTWVAFGAGRVMVGLDAGDALFDTAEETGGSKDAVVVSHTHTITDPGHSHAPPSGLSAPWVGNDFFGDGNIDGSNHVGAGERNTQSGNTQTATTGISANTTGVSGTNGNLQPYITVRMWKRTA